ncbi:CRISPR-associated endonuclease Cas2 [Candidatus Gracilibacteria bacterium GN02-873]|nr:CRISPR-associated endonuclease Cas2 [Candidatus Gracilibacteria bacterium]RAL56482.1 CRISPR-associated endonuclease Cas2 [Candidatus Gracilibacteria bacterium GN02-873]
MLIISYDIANDKIRTKFSKFLTKYGRRIQYSVYEIQNSDRLLSVIQAEIEGTFEPQFSPADTVLIVPISLADEKKIIKYGYGANDDLDFLFIE